jgi:hypothetical protein
MRLSFAQLQRQIVHPILFKTGMMLKSTGLLEIGEKMIAYGGGIGLSYFYSVVIPVIFVTTRTSTTTHSRPTVLSNIKLWESLYCSG